MTSKIAEINPRIEQYILTHYPLARKKSNFSSESSLLNSGIIDSMGVMDLVLFLESEFDITLSDEDLQPENFQTITNIVSFVHNKLLDN